MATAYVFRGECCFREQPPRVKRPAATRGQDEGFPVFCIVRYCICCVMLYKRLAEELLKELRLATSWTPADFHNVTKSESSEKQQSIESFYHCKDSCKFQLCDQLVKAQAHAGIPVVSMVSSPAPSTPAGGIVQRGAERLIPASKRPDGSVRKEKKVREGFVPAEDVAKYQTVKARERAAANGVVPGRPVVSEALPPQTETPLSTGTMTKTQQKNVKRRLKRQQQSLEQGVQQQQPVEESPAEIKTLKQGIALLLGEMLVADITDVCEALAFEHDTWNRSEKIQAILERVESGCHNTVDLTVQYAKMTALRESLLKLGLSRSGDRDALVSRLQEALARLPGTEAVPDLRWSATAKKQEAQRSQAEGTHYVYHVTVSEIYERLT